MPSAIEEKLLNLRQDGVIWKATMIWSTATNPDSQADATNSLVKLLICIGGEVKRNSYIDRIAASFLENKRDQDNAIKDLEQQDKSIERLINKLDAKKKPDPEDETRRAEYEEERKETQKKGEDLRRNILPIIKSTELSKFVKEELAAIDKKKQQKAHKDAVATNEESNQDMNLPSDFVGDKNEVVRFGVYTYKGRYFSKNSKGFYDEISNFTMEIIHHVQTSVEAAYRLCTLKNVYGIDKMLMINTDDLVGVGTFKKVLARQGDFIFKGSDSDLSRLSEYLQRKEKASEVVEVLGHHNRGKCYVFANGLVDTSDENPGNFMPTDEYGMVELRDKHYLIPAMSKMFAEKDGMYVNEKKFLYVENKKMNFEEWSKLHLRVYNVNAIMCQLWVISALFRDIIHGLNDIRATPILCMYGQRGSGKGKCADSIMNLFGVGQAPIALGSHSTPKGFLRKFAQLRNAVVWLDEYKNNIKKDFVEALKNIYDGFSYSRAMKSMDFQTEDMPVNSACLLSGQEMPTIEPALFSRVILLQFLPGKDRNDEDRKAFKRLKDEEAHGISSIVVEILKHRPAIKESFATVFEKKQKQLFEKVANPDVDDRFILCIAILATIREVMDPHLKFAFSQEQAETILVANLREQFAVMQGNDDIGKFWQVVEFLASQRVILENKHYFFDGSQVYIRLNDIYPLYARELLKNRNDPNTLAKSTLESYLKTDKDAFVDHQKKKKLPGTQLSMWTWEFNYAVLKERYKLELAVIQRDPNKEYPDWSKDEDDEDDNFGGFKQP